MQLNMFDLKQITMKWKLIIDPPKEPFSIQEDIFRLIWKEVIDWKSVSKQRKLHEMKL